MGWGGDAISRLTGRRFYIDSTRVESMTTDYPIPMTASFQVLGRGGASLEQGILQTAAWLQRVRGWKLPQKTLAALTNPSKDG